MSLTYGTILESRVFQEGGGETQFGEMAEQIHYGNIARQLFPTLF